MKLSRWYETKNRFPFGNLYIKIKGSFMKKIIVMSLFSIFSITSEPSLAEKSDKRRLRG